MKAERRRFLRNAVALAACVGCAKSMAQATRVIADGAGRKVVLPQRAERIYAAGPPASILVFAVAPDKLVGWTSAFRETERPFVARRYADLPPSINRLIGLRWLARILYPRAFPEDLRPIVRDFHTRCYHQTPTDAQLDELLRTALPA